MQGSSRKLLVLVIAAVLVAAVVWTVRRTGERHKPLSSPPQTTLASNTSPAPAAQTGASLEDKLRQFSHATQDTPPAARMAELRAALAAVPKDQAVAQIRRFLDSKEDASTGQGFKISGSGFLDEAPTLRAFLLDYLGRTDPAAAAEYARVILASPDSADEWALALRNLARGDESPAGRALLDQKTSELLRNQAWQQSASVGYLEAFDAAVFLGTTNLVPPLADLVRNKENPATGHAAYLAMDRMVINNPTTMLNALEANPDLMQGREQTRANYFARADVRDPQQKQVIENYLLDPRINVAELQQFAGLYPSANYMISHNLLTPTPTPDHAALTSRDAESLRVVNEWLADDRFEKVRPQLQKMKSRLEEFTRQANGK